MDSTSTTHLVQLYVSSENPICDEVAEALLAWGNCRKQTKVQAIPILDDPENVVRLGIFYTPALVINGTLIAGGISSTADLLQFLPK